MPCPTRSFVIRNSKLGQEADISYKHKPSAYQYPRVFPSSIHYGRCRSVGSADKKLGNADLNDDQELKAIEILQERFANDEATEDEYRVEEAYEVATKAGYSSDLQRTSIAASD